MPQVGNCSQCGAVVQSDWLACPKCGSQFAVSPEQVKVAHEKRPWWHWAAAGVGVLVALAIVGAALGRGSSKSDAAAAPSPAATRELATLSIDGTPALQFSGSIQDGAGGHSVEGVVPSVYNLQPAGVYSVVFQKRGRPGVLTVTITCNGERRMNTTSAEFGVVSVTCS